jgi:predicted ribosome quality control (RQC) complex YloA/Tae2 family protein
VDTPSTLLQLLRKYVRGAALMAVHQPPWERILRLDFQHPEFGHTAIVVELIGRWANLLLVRRVSSPSPPAPLPPGGEGRVLHTSSPSKGEGSGAHTSSPSEREGSGAHTSSPSKGEGSGAHTPSPSKGEGSGAHTPSPSEREGSGAHTPSPSKGEGSGAHTPSPSEGEGWGEGEFRILECVHRHRPQDGATRPALPGQFYQPPPAQSGLAPDALDDAQARRLLDDAPAERLLWRALVDSLQGLSPLAAREIVQRAYGDAQARVGEASEVAPLVGTVAGWVAMLRAGAWQPCLACDAAGAPVAFAPFALTHRSDARLEMLASISQAAERFYGEKAHTSGDSYAVARRQVAASIERAVRGLQKRRDAIQRELRPAGEIERLRASGEWILALATQIRPRQAELALPEGVELPPIRLDPALAPADNAAAYFKRYRKAKRAAAMGEPRLEALAGELSYLDQLSADLALAADRNEIDAVRAALAEAGYARRRARSAPSGVQAKTGPSQGEERVQGPRRFTSAEGYTILVGRNSRQNEHITFDLAGPDDLWLHARGWPGSHVVIRSGGRPVRDETVAQAAGLAAFYSKAQREAWVDVIVVEKKRVRRPPGKRHPGMVVVEGERVVRVRPYSGVS